MDIKKDKIEIINVPISTNQGTAGPTYRKLKFPMEENNVEKQSDMPTIEAPTSMVFPTPQFKELLHNVDPTIRKDFKIEFSPARTVMDVDKVGISAIKCGDSLKIYNKEIVEPSFNPVEPVQLTTMIQEVKIGMLKSQLNPLFVKSIWYIPLSCCPL